MTIEDESGAVQCVLGPRVFARYRRALRGPVLLVTGTVARWDGATTLAVARVESVPPTFLCQRLTTGTEGGVGTMPSYGGPITLRCLAVA